MNLRTLTPLALTTFLSLGAMGPALAQDGAGLPLPAAKEPAPQPTRGASWDEVSGSFHVGGVDCSLRVDRARQEAFLYEYVVQEEPERIESTVRHGAFKLSPGLARQLGEAIAASEPIQPYSQEELARGARGPAVAALQRALGLSADGIYGPRTQRAVGRLQREQGLRITGRADLVTQQALAAGADSFELTRAGRRSYAPAARVGGVMRMIALSVLHEGEPELRTVSGQVVEQDTGLFLNGDDGVRYDLLGVRQDLENAAAQLRAGTFRLRAFPSVETDQGTMAEAVITGLRVRATPESLPKGVAPGDVRVIGTKEVPTRTIETPSGRRVIVGGTVVVVEDAQGKRGYLEHPYQAAALARGPALEGAAQQLRQSR